MVDFENQVDEEDVDEVDVLKDMVSNLNELPTDVLRQLLTNLEEIEEYNKNHPEELEDDYDEDEE
ncbi:MAG: hypothetical protein IJX17_07865 [Clostridia bacterium]|nr:hypothetical protein [Clostridia bacterium]